MVLNNTLEAQSSTAENLTPLCFSCLEKLFEKCPKSELSVLESILGEGGKMCLTGGSDTQPRYCGICAKSITRSWIPTATYYTLLTQLGTLLRGLN